MRRLRLVEGREEALADRSERPGEFSLEVNARPPAAVATSADMVREIPEYVRSASVTTLIP